MKLKLNFLLAAALPFAAPSPAETVVYSVTGTVSSIGGTGGPFPVVEVGDQINLTLTITKGIQGSPGFHGVPRPNSMQYTMPSAPTMLSGTVGPSATFSTGGSFNVVSVANDAPDQLNVYSPSGVTWLDSDGATRSGGVDFTVSDPQGTAFSSTDLPTGPIAGFSEGQVFLSTTVEPFHQPKSLFFQFSPTFTLIFDSATVPDIGVEQPALTNIVDGGSKAFPDTFVDSATSRTFTIKNTGPASLTGLAVTIDGTHSADFTLISPPVAPVSGPNGTTTFAVQFRPSALGTRSAALHIASNDPDEGTFDINLTGTGLGISVQPVSQVVNQNDPVFFLVGVNGPTPTFQWRKDGLDLPGETNDTLVISSAQPWQIGDYSVRITSAAGSIASNAASLGLTGVPSGIWRGLVACYPFDGSVDDVCRPDKPAGFVNTSELAVDPQRGGVASIRGKGFGVPPFQGEPVDQQGPGGYLQIPRPSLGAGEPFTVSFLIKEEGYSLWHGESFMTMGEGSSSVDLLGHYWIGSLGGTDENYGGNNVAVTEDDSNYVLNGAAVTLNVPWTLYTIVANGDIVRLYRDGRLKGIAPYKKDTVGDFFVGRHWWANGANYSTRLVGKIDDLRIYNRALTPQDVQQLSSQTPGTPPRNSFESWTALYGLSGVGAGVSADPDRDGISNRDEFWFGTSPVNPSASLMKAVAQGGILSLEWMERDEVHYRLAESLNLLPPWTESLRIPTLSADQNGVPSGYQRMRVEIPLPDAASPSPDSFFRIEATSSPLIKNGGQVLIQPASGEVVAGQPVSFAVAAAGEDLTYQWYKNELPIAGAISTGYSIAAAQLSATGNYSVVVTNSVGSVTSQKVFLLVTE